MLSFRFVQTHITDRSLLSEVMAAVPGSSANRGLPRDLLYSVVKVHRENLSPHFISDIFWGIHNLGIPLFTKCLHFVEHEEILSTLLLDIFGSSYERFFDIFSFFTFSFAMVLKRPLITVLLIFLKKYKAQNIIFLLISLLHNFFGFNNHKIQKILKKSPHYCIGDFSGICPV